MTKRNKLGQLQKEEFEEWVHRITTYKLLAVA